MDGTTPQTRDTLTRKVALLHRWHTDLAAARAEALQTGKPILQLWLLGRLDDELSCANSRFFRATLYPDRAVRAALAQRFVLCWQTFREVPVVTIDFGDGRKLTRTLTGNSVHVVLDPHGRPVDALPGVYRPTAFLAGLRFAERAARATASLNDPERRRVLAAAHQAARPLPTQPPSTDPFSARLAGALATSKMRVEAPLLNGTRDLFESLAEDEHKNETQLHPQIRAMFARGEVGADATRFAHRVYRDVFLMSHDDPWLGLRAGHSMLSDDGLW